MMIRFTGIDEKSEYLNKIYALKGSAKKSKDQKTNQILISMAFKCCPNIGLNKYYSISAQNIIYSADNYTKNPLISRLIRARIVCKIFLYLFCIKKYVISTELLINGNTFPSTSLIIFSDFYSAFS